MSETRQRPPEDNTFTPAQGRSARAPLPHGPGQVALLSGCPGPTPRGAWKTHLEGTAKALGRGGHVMLCFRPKGLGQET